MNCLAVREFTKNKTIEKFDKNKPLYSIDWCHGVITGFTDVNFLFSEFSKIDPRLSFCFWKQWDRPLYAYSKRFQLNDEGYFSVAFLPAFDRPECMIASLENTYAPYIFISITGDGLRFLGSKTVRKLFDFLHRYQFRCSRLDIACDIFDKDNPYVDVFVRAFEHSLSRRTIDSDVSLVSRFALNSIKIYSNWNDVLGKITKNVQIGTRKSKHAMFRMYDKYVELTQGRLKNFSADFLSKIPEKYWYRFEFELHHQKAADVWCLLACNQINCAQAFKRACDVFRIVSLYKKYKPSDCSDSLIWYQFLLLCDVVGGHECLIQTVDFVQFKFSTLPKRLAYMERMSSFLYLSSLISIFSPSICSEILEKGRLRLFSDKRNITLVYDLLNAFCDCESDKCHEIYEMIYNSRR